ncbi:DUF2249 domain-containing protein [Natrinema ejinorense]|uniref:DUF2249 domain-containing protein n=1 Tax=Natrinema ejinorense TaxID=373386 RepID=A0A2A5QVC8_9EURY|nr:DUF2249 domain-containing protein [Natrinema ejinorense]PCR90743.1 hypothetical protein CP557_09600 [Natrinema ejinorense]
MQSLTSVVDRTAAPSDRPQEHLDVRSLGPPNPLQQTLERLVELPDETVLIQQNDRVPQFLFPKLDDRGYRYETVERDDDVVTVIWRED